MSVYFKVGEEVGLVSKTYPEMDGQYIVEDILISGSEVVFCPLTGSLINSPPSGTSYKLEGLSVKGINMWNEETGDVLYWMAQESLRKLDKGAGSWEDMMTNLNEPIEEMM